MSNFPISDRLFQYLNHRGIGLSSFAYNCGVSQNALLQILPESKRVYNKIHFAYPDLNQEWLKTGVGNMIVAQINKPTERTDNAQTRQIPPQQTRQSATRSTKKSIVSTPANTSRVAAIWNRIDVFRLAMGITALDFNAKLGVDFNLEVLNGNTDAAIKLICSKYPKLNPLWLEMGEGEMLKARQKSTKRTDKIITWKSDSIGYQWALEQVKEGVPRSEVIAEFNKRHISNPKDYSTRRGKPLSAGVLSVWIKNEGITPPAYDRQHPYKKQEVIPQISVSVELEKPKDNQEDKGNEVCAPTIIKDETSAKPTQRQTKPNAQEQNKTKHSKKTNWGVILKGIAMVVGAIGGIFLVVYIIVEFVFPAIFLALLFLSMLFAKK